MKTVRLRAPAKVNLTLDVIGRRADGYHELRSVIARVSLADDVRVTRARGWHSVVRPRLGIPTHEELATRAARALASRLGRDDGAAISIRKRVPRAAGLGGGSSDAAATLRALALLWDAREDALLRAAALDVGSDVPFFLDGPLADIRGRGDDVRPLRGGPWWGVLVLVPCRVATAEAFALLPRAAWNEGTRSAALVDALERGPLDAAGLRSRCANAFDALAARLCPPVEAIRASLPDASLFLSGTGPTLFAVCEDRARALALRRRVRRAGHRAIPVQIAVGGSTIHPGVGRR